MNRGDRPLVLIVEDNVLVGQLLADVLADADFDIDGPYTELADGMVAVARHFPDFALLDIKLGDHDASMIAQDLEAYGIGFAFCSGASPTGPLGQAFHRHPFLSKPIDLAALVRTVRAGVRSGASIMPS